MAEEAAVLLALGEVKGTLTQLVSAVSRGHSRVDDCEKRLNALEVEGGKVGLKVYLICSGVAAVAAGGFHYMLSYLAPAAKAAGIL